MSYKDLLKRAKKESKKQPLTKSRFKIPKIKTMKEGNKTIIKNFSKISQELRRNPDHLMKFLQRELAAPGEMDNSRLILQRNLNKKLIKKKLNSYVNKYVLCPACNKPDTKLLEEDRILKIKCEACGIKQAVET